MLLNVIVRRNRKSLQYTYFKKHAIYSVFKTRKRKTSVLGGASIYIYNYINRCILCHYDVLQKGIGRVRVHANTFRADHGPWPKQHWQLPLHQLLLGLLPRLSVGGPNASMISLHQHASVSIKFSLVATNQQ